MRIVERTNKSTGEVEKYLVTDAQLLTIESESKVTKVNGKPYGFFNARVGGKLASGIAYDAVLERAGREQFVPGATIQVEALVSDVRNGDNNKWKIALPTADSLSEDISNFLDNL